MLTNIETLQQLRQGSAGIIYFSRYRADQVDNGGARRVAQLLQLLGGYEAEFVTSLKKPTAVDTVATRAGSLLNKAVQAVVRGCYRQYSEEFATWIFFSRRLASRWASAVAKRNNLQLVIVDDPIYFAPLVKALHYRGIAVVAHCHNIETLSRAQMQVAPQQQQLAAELGLLSLCRAAVTISREETFLLRNIGLKTCYLPYYPPRSIEQRLLAVRQLRTQTVKRDFLLLGSAGNAPTGNGMRQLMAIWDTIRSQLAGDRLIVAGYGTERLRAAGSCAGLEIAGALTDAELDKLLSRVRASLVYQEDGAGALTRIAEFLLAGVPVVANDHAARSYHNLPGVMEFADNDGLLTLLGAPLPESHEVFLPVAPDPVCLLNIFDSILGG